MSTFNSTYLVTKPSNPVIVDPHKEATHAFSSSQVEALLQLPMHPDPHSGGTTPLIRACQNGHEHVAQLLLEAGAAKDFSDRSGRTALMRAASSGREPVVQLLLDARAQKDFCDSSGNTALILAAIHSHPSIYRLLREAGADQHLRNKRGQTARLVAKARLVRVATETLKLRGRLETSDESRIYFLYSKPRPFSLKLLGRRLQAASGFRRQ